LVAAEITYSTKEIQYFLIGLAQGSINKIKEKRKQTKPDRTTRGVLAHTRQRHQRTLPGEKKNGRFCHTDQAPGRGRRLAWSVDAVGQAALCATSAKT
jgi:hypothetical protein